LKGTATIGIYALLSDNTSWFIAADFDGDNWENECKNYLGKCNQIVFQPILKDHVQEMVDMYGFSSMLHIRL